MEVGQVKERMLEKARKRMAGLCGAGIKQGLSVSAAVKGWEVLVRPVLEYGCEIWGAGRWGGRSREAAEQYGKENFDERGCGSGGAGVVEDGGEEGFSSASIMGEVGADG